MHLTVAAIGKLKSGPAFEMVEDYAKRCNGLGRQVGLSGPKIIEVEASKALSGAVLQAKEAELLAPKLPEAGLIYILDEKGKALTSQSFANGLAQARDDGVSDATFIIGGADGHGPAIRSLAKTRGARLISFGPATWPHMMVRAMLIEQLYRAITLLAGHPYHRV